MKHHPSQTLQWIVQRRATRIGALIALGLGFLIILNSIVFMYQSHAALCKVAATKLPIIAGPLGRELLLGETGLAQNIFEEFEETIRNAGATGPIQLKTSPLEQYSTETQPVCTPGIFSASIYFPVRLAGQQLGSIRGKATYFVASRDIAAVALVLLLVLLIVRQLTSTVINQIELEFVEPIRRLSRAERLDTTFVPSLEVLEIQKNLERLKEEVATAEREAAEVDSARELSDLASQVAHDIRSPAAALKVVAEVARDLPDTYRSLLREAAGKINAIANQLLDHARNRSEKFSKKQESVPSREVGIVPTLQTSTCLASLLESVVTEKRFELQGRPEVEIETIIESSGYDSFSCISAVDLKRILSNLINNAFEAIEGAGTVILRLATSCQEVFISVEDSGRGIPPEVIEHLGKRGATFGKAKGNGLGLYSARKTVESAGGEFSIASNAGRGTKVQLKLPKHSPPPWFIREIKIERNSEVIIVDDDPSIHRVWESRLLSTLGINERPSLKHFTSIREATAWVTHQAPNSRRVFWVDFEFRDDGSNGLCFIQQSGISDRSLLVTNSYEEKEVLDGCARLGIPLLPKSLAGHIPIRAA